MSTRIANEDEFWPLFEKCPDGCWVWQGDTDHHGYGSVRYAGMTWTAQRLASYFQQPRPMKGYAVRQTCGNLLCGNPEHLLCATRGEIAGSFPRPSGKDHWTFRMPERVKRGEEHVHARLNEDQVRQARILFASGWPVGDIARLIGAEYAWVYHVCKRKTWNHI